MKKRTEKRFLSLVLALTLVVGSALNVSAADTAHTTDATTALETANAQLSKEAAIEGMVMLENKNNALPIAKGSTIALFGGASYATIKGGTGSGDVNQRYTVSIMDGLKSAYSLSNEAWWTNYISGFEAGKAAKTSNDYVTRIPGSFGGADTYIAKDIAITADDIQNAKANGVTTAVYTLSRVSGEGSDRTITKGEYLLSDVEEANIKLLANSFDKSIVILNVGGIVDTKFFDQIPALDSLFLMSQAGMEGGNALAKIFTGEASPSGKLTDTWAENYSDYPASQTIGNTDGDNINEEYAEGIYVGYRYFDTFGVKPAYEFGYGKSYTDFSVEPVSVTADASKVTVKAKVTNIGNTYSGKEVVQVYFSSPEGSIEKPYQELAAYAKTDVLAPKQTQTVTITYNTTEMSSYNTDKSLYMMEDGAYTIRVGNSSRNTHVAAVLNLSKDITTEVLSRQFANDNGLQELTNLGANSYSYATEATEKANAPKINLDFTGFVAKNNRSIYNSEAITTYLTGTTPYTKVSTNETTVNVSKITNPNLYDVYTGKYTMEQFVAQLDPTQLANIVNGKSGSIGTATSADVAANSVQGAAGETTGMYYDDLGIPNIVLADGPAGVRVSQNYSMGDNGVIYTSKDDTGYYNTVSGTKVYAPDGVTVSPYYQFCTAWPIGTALAQTWNNDLIQRVGVAIGQEMAEYGVTLWLAPGMNIHRDPLCGRNFEYYSEDPYLTGAIGTYTTLGVQSIPGIGVTIKHYAGNNQETNRSYVNNWTSERAMREIYLKGFEMTIKSAQPMAIMSSYNKINGIYAVENHDLCTDLARGEWKFDGMIMSDWGAGGRASVNGIMHAGNDIVMPGSTQKRIVAALSGAPIGTTANPSLDSKLALGDVQKCAVRVLKTIMQSTQFAKMHKADGVTAKAYAAKYTNLAVYETVAKSAIATVVPTAAPTTVPTTAPTAAPTYKDQIKATTSKTLYLKGNTGKTFTISVTKPAAAVIASTTFKSSKTSIATVSTSGKVTAKKAGTATITTTVTLTNGEVATLTTKVTVKNAYVKFTATKASITKGKTFTFKAKAYGNTKKITWKVSNTKIGKITSAGKFTAKAKGTVKITATSGTFSKTVTVKVK